MVIWKKKCIWVLLQALEFSLTTKFVSFENLFMVWNNLPEHGLTDLPPLLNLKASLRNILITHCLQKRSKSRKIALLIAYVADLVLSGDDIVKITKLKKKMSDEFEIKDLGNLMYFLRMEVARSREGIFVSQRTLLTC